MAMLRLGMGETAVVPHPGHLRSSLPSVQPRPWIFREAIPRTSQEKETNEPINGAKIWLSPSLVPAELTRLWAAVKADPGGTLTAPGVLGFLLVPAAAILALVLWSGAARTRRARNPRRRRAAARRQRANPRRVGRGRNPRDARGVDGPMAGELVQFIENDAGLDRQQHTPIIKNLTAKKARGVYDHAKAVKLFGYLVESGLKKYAREYGSGPWHEMAGMATRKAAAEDLTRGFEEEHALGNYDNFIPEKYRTANLKRRRNAGPRSVRRADKRRAAQRRRK